MPSTASVWIDRASSNASADTGSAKLRAISSIATALVAPAAGWLASGGASSVESRTVRPAAVTETRSSGGHGSAGSNCRVRASSQVKAPGMPRRERDDTLRLRARGDLGRKEHGDRVPPAQEPVGHDDRAAGRRRSSLRCRRCHRDGRHRRQRQQEQSEPESVEQSPKRVHRPSPSPSRSSSSNSSYSSESSESALSSDASELGLLATERSRRALAACNATRAAGVGRGECEEAPQLFGRRCVRRWHEAHRGNPRRGRAAGRWRQRDQVIGAGCERAMDQRPPRDFSAGVVREHGLDPAVFAAHRQADGPLALDGEGEAARRAGGNQEW